MANCYQRDEGGGDGYVDCANCRIEHRTVKWCAGCAQWLCLGCYDDHNEVEEK